MESARQFTRHLWDEAKKLNKMTSSIHFGLLSFQYFNEIFVLHGTCCKVWRKLPSLHLSHWCEWHLSQPAGCWSRSGNHQGWNSSVETWGRRSTVSPRHVVSHLGHSCKPSPHEETPPDQDIAASLHLNNSAHRHQLNITSTWCHMSHLQSEVSNNYASCKSKVLVVLYWFSIAFL